MRRGRALIQKGAKRVEVELWWWGSRRGHRGSSELRGLEGMVCRVIRGSSKLVGLVLVLVLVDGMCTRKKHTGHGDLMQINS